MTGKIYSIYNELCRVPSDINEHLPVLHRYARNSRHITEMGVRWISSTWAFLAAHPKRMISYDIKNPAEWGADVNVPLYFSLYEEIDYMFIQADVLTVDIEETDLLFIDTLHNYTQLKEELRLHSGKVHRHIILHDTVNFADHDESGDGPGLVPALTEFLQENTMWKIREQYTNNNGLTVLERQ